MASAKAPRLRYHCVSIVAGSQACEIAKSMRDIRILSAQAPRLPLANCPAPQTCRCTYRHHDDRRAGPRRARELGERPDPSPIPDRRRSIGRRETD
jgi:hypothetical protein